MLNVYIYKQNYWDYDVILLRTCCISSINYCIHIHTCMYAEHLARSAIVSDKGL